MLLSGLRYDTLWEIIKNSKLNYIIQNINTIRTWSCFGINDKQWSLEWIESRFELFGQYTQFDDDLLNRGSRHNLYDLDKHYNFSKEGL